MTRRKFIVVGDPCDDARPSDRKVITDPSERARVSPPLSAEVMAECA